MAIKITEKRSLRKDFGDVTQLMDSIKKVGLINRITLSKDGVIVAGRRRFRAWQQLHKKYPKQYEATPPVEILPLTYKELMNQPNFNMFNMVQLHENTMRKEFTAEEIASIKKDIEKQRAEGKMPEASGRDTRDIVGELTGMGGQKVDKIDTIVEYAKKSSKGKKILQDLNKNHISVNTAHQMVTKMDRNLPKIPPPEGEYDRIYADIPIEFEDSGGRGAAENHYPTEPKEYFLNLEIPAAKDCVIFFWIPNAFLIDGTAAQILDNWGFYPKAIFTWKKDRIGRGAWSRNQTEHLIMGIKGNMPTPAKLYPTIFEANRTEHSRKPDDYVIKMMDGMYPKRKSIILWHRGAAPKGWDVHGNEVETKLVNLQDSEEIKVGDPVKVKSELKKPESPIQKLKNSRKK